MSSENICEIDISDLANFLKDNYFYDVHANVNLLNMYIDAEPFEVEDMFVSIDNIALKELLKCYKYRVKGFKSVDEEGSFEINSFVEFEKIC
jgi:hypothetical protein